MKDLVELLDPRERRSLQILLFALFASLALFIFVLSWERGRVRSLEEELAGRKKSLEQVQEAREKSQLLWRQWSEASRHLDELKQNWYYRGDDGLRQMRLDLGKIMAEAGLSVPPIHYDYQDLEKGRLRKVSLSFRFVGSYFTLRDLIARLESFPKFLCLERLDFQNIGERGNLELRLVVAGYYVL